MKVLLISEHSEDTQIIGNIIKTVQSNIDVIWTKGPEEAMTQAGNNGPFGMFIIDVDFKDVDVNAMGLNLVEFAGARPIIFFGTEAVFKDRISEKLYSCNEFNQEIFRPTSRNEFAKELTSAVSNALRWAKQEEFAENVVEINPDDYMQLKLRSFYMYDEFAYDIYLPMTSTCYVKIISAGKPYAHSTLASYAKKNVRYLYIKKDEHLKFLETETKKCLKAIRDAKNDHKDIYLIYLRSISIFHGYLATIGLTSAANNLCEKISDGIIAHSQAMRKTGNILTKYPTFYQGIGSKSLLTAFICMGLADAIGWESQTTKKKLVISALLQDHCLEDDLLCKINYELDEKLKTFPEEVQEKYLQHPIHCATIAKQFSAYPDLDFIIENHHELPSRLGFPRKRSLSKLTQINAVFNIAQCIAGEIDGQKYDSKLLNKVLKGMSREYAVGIFKDTLKMAQRVLKPT